MALIPMEWYVPFLIFGARICDVSIGTVRMIFVIGGHRYIAAALGFFEVMIWAMAIGGLIRFLTEPPALVAWGAGFACGSLTGMYLEERIAIGFRMVRVITSDLGQNISSLLRERGFRVTRIEGEGLRGPVEIAFLAVRRRDLHQVLSAIDEVAPDAFVTVERADRAGGASMQRQRQALERK